MRISTVLAFAGAVCLPLLHTAPAQAQATQTWVSGVGNDANPCSRTAPCRTFAGAISKTAVAGEINCLDPGAFGGLTITNSIAIICQVGTAGVLASGTNGITVSTPAGSIVKLQGLDFEGVTTGLIGISFTGAGLLHVEDCIIRGFNSGSAIGINFAPTGAAQLFVSDTYISNNGSGANGGGILVKPNGSGSAQAFLDGIRVEGNASGITADGTGSTGPFIELLIRDTVVSGSANSGITVTGPAGGRPPLVMMDRSASVGNGTTGVIANGTGSTLLMGNSTVTLNATGVGSGGGAIYSYKDNGINGNTTIDGTPLTGTPLN